jgi:hypothetical protein
MFSSETRRQRADFFGGTVSRHNLNDPYTAVEGIPLAALIDLITAS